MDTLINPIITTTQTDMATVVWNYLVTNFFLNPMFIASCLFVIFVIEILKLTLFKKYPISADAYPFVSLILSCISVLLVTDFTFSKEYLFKLLLTISSVDMVYTFFGVKILEMKRNKFSKN